MAAPTDIVVLLIALLDANWTPGNTGSITPEVGSGWFEPGGGPNQVVVAGVPDESARGSSGIAGIRPGGGNVQQMAGVCLVECFSEERDDAIDNPEKLAHLFMREVQRIIMANVNSVAGYDYVSFLGANRRPPSEDERPFLYGQSCRIGFGWRLEL